jgi:hypothetical protein
MSITGALTAPPPKVGLKNPRKSRTVRGRADDPLFPMDPKNAVRSFVVDRTCLKSAEASATGDKLAGWHPHETLVPWICL